MGKSTLPYCGLVVSLLCLLLPVNNFHRAGSGFQESDVFSLTDFYLSGIFINGACDLVRIRVLDYPNFWFSFVHFVLLLIVWLTANTLGKKIYAGIIPQKQDRRKDRPRISAGL